MVKKIKSKLKFYRENAFWMNLRTNREFFFCFSIKVKFILIVLGSVLMFVYLADQMLVMKAYSFDFDKFKIEIAAIRETVVLPDGSLKKNCVPYEDFVSWYRDVKMVYLKAESRIIADRGFYEPMLKEKVGDLLLVIKWIEQDGITNHESGIRAICVYKSELFKTLLAEVKQGFNFK